MANTYTSRLRFVTQATGDNLSVWGSILNSQMIAMVDEAVAGVTSFTLSGTKVLSSANGASDEARRAVLNITSGTGGTVTIPSVTKAYLVRNATTGNVTITTGAGTTAIVPTGDYNNVFCDGVNVFLAKDYNFAGQRITGIGTPTAATDGANKSYADAILVSANQYTDAVATASGNLPNQTGNSGKTLTTNGTAASWVTLASLGVALTANNLSDLPSVVTARANLGLGNSSVLNVGSVASTVAAGDDTRIVNALQKGLNLADINNAASARTNLGLGALATATVAPIANGGTAATTAAAARTNLGLGTAAQQNSGTFLQSANNLSDLSSLAAALGNLGLAGVFGAVFGNTQFNIPMNVAGITRIMYIKLGYEASVGANSQRTTTFSGAFPNACFGVFPIARVSTYASNNDSHAKLVGTPTASGCVLANTTAGGTIDIPYIAFGW